jgi:hypothetical protein
MVGNGDEVELGDESDREGDVEGEGKGEGDGAGDVIKLFFNDGGLAPFALIAIIDT